MKRNMLMLMLAFSLIAFSQNAVAQKQVVTAKTATAKDGYTVMNEGETIIIYKYAHTAHPPKASEKYPVKYFFTTGTADVLQPLTKANLKKAFPNNHPFHDALDANFKEDTDLILYDDFHKMYKINRVLKNNS